MSSITARSMRMGRMSCRRVPNDEPNPRQRHHGAAHTEPSTVPSRPVSELCRSVPRSTDKATARPHCSRRRAGSPQRLYGHGIAPNCRRPHVPHRGYEAVITLSNDGPPSALGAADRGVVGRHRARTLRRPHHLADARRLGWPGTRKPPWAPGGCELEGPRRATPLTAVGPSPEAHRHTRLTPWPAAPPVPSLSPGGERAGPLPPAPGPLSSTGPRSPGGEPVRRLLPGGR